METAGITGVLGQEWRADVTPWGAIVPWEGTPVLDWHVAADDRWHSPAHEAAVRQSRPDGAAVFETRLRVPGGDAVHRVWSVADGGGCTVVEVTNDSPLPLACAFTRPDLMTDRPPADVPIQGIDLPAESTVLLPIGHRASVRVALPHHDDGASVRPARLPSAEAVARGWVAVAERASRLVLPDERLAAAVVAARCDVLLAGPPSPADDPAGFLVSLGELVRMGELDGAALAVLLENVATAVQEIAPRRAWDVDAALDAAAIVLARAGERRAVADVTRIVAARPPSPVPDGQVGIRTVAGVERRLARGAQLFPDGLPAAWLGAGIEAHRLAAGPATTVSFAVRWPGERPAVLWELSGDPVELTAPALDPSWRSSAPTGEALWPPVLSVGVDALARGATDRTGGPG